MRVLLRATELEESSSTGVVVVGSGYGCLRTRIQGGEVQACIYNGGGRRDQSTALTFCACVGMANLAGHGQDAETASRPAAAKIAAREIER